MTTEADDKQEAVADDNQADALETIDLTLRIISEPADAARFPPASTVMLAVCRAVAETLELNGRFYIAPVRIAWNPDSEEGDARDDNGDGWKPARRMMPQLRLFPPEITIEDGHFDTGSG